MAEPGEGRRADLDRLVSEVERWTSYAASREAALERSRRRWVAQRAAEEATFESLLVDLAERSATVTLGTSSGRAHTARLLAVGSDYVAAGVSATAPAAVLLPLRSITSLRPAPGGADPEPMGRRARTVDGSLADLLQAVAADRRRVLLVLSGGAVLRGELSSAGSNVLTLRTDGVPPSSTYVQLDSVSEVSVLGSG
jgi:hypothetical protein